MCGISVDPFNSVGATYYKLRDRQKLAGSVSIIIEVVYSPDLVDNLKISGVSVRLMAMLSSTRILIGVT